MSQSHSQPPPSNPTTTTTTSTPNATPKTTNPSEPNPTLYETGLATRRTVVGPTHVTNTLANSNAFTQPMQEMITEWAWGSIWNRPGLELKQRSLLNIGILIALNRQHELGIHVRGAVRNGLSEVEIREAVMHSTVYCGAPAGMEGMRTVDRVLGEMERGGEIKREIV
ncbi:AhpD-like protein [Aspergillus cavernicola]|uniref:AhpD-like protein n=1 Tax=Aspergillus cavernicola TaxID=176166 RepID=A0ABR4IWH2_9EURO